LAFCAPRSTNWSSPASSRRSAATGSNIPFGRQYTDWQYTGQGPLRDLPDASRHHLEAITLAFIGEGLT
jgi:hypothetical protein